jgi:hypothetical protein
MVYIFERHHDQWECAMSGIKWELLLELGWVLLAPWIHQAYLWRKGKLTPQGLRSAAKLFAPLYGLVLCASVLWLWSA